MRARYACTSSAVVAWPVESASRSSPIVAFSTQTALAARASDAAISASAPTKQPRSGARATLFARRRFESSALFEGPHQRRRSRTSAAHLNLPAPEPKRESAFVCSAPCRSRPAPILSIAHDGSRDGRKPSPQAPQALASLPSFPGDKGGADPVILCHDRCRYNLAPEFEGV